MILCNTNDFQFAGATLLQYTGNDSIISVPDGVVKIAERAFENNKKIEQIVLPDTLECIEPYAFYKCKKLKTVNFPQGLKKIGLAAFKECGLESVHIPSSVELIEKSAFQFCRNLSKVEIAPPQGKLVVGGYVFQNAAIEEITFPVGVVEIGNYAISACENLKQVHILEKTAKLGDLLVYLDENLDSVFIPNGVKSLKARAFMTDAWSGGQRRCCPSTILAPLGPLKHLWNQLYEPYYIANVAAGTYMENTAIFSKKEQNSWDTFIAENAVYIRQVLGDKLSAKMTQYLESRGL